MLHSNTETNRKQFRSHQRMVKKAVDAAKEEWACRVAKTAETTSQRGGICWDALGNSKVPLLDRNPRDHELF